MTVKIWWRLAGVAIVVVLGMSLYVAWRDARREKTQLQEQLNSAEAELRVANTRQETRNAELQQQLAEIQRKKARVQKPEDVLKALPEVLPLPKPLIVEENPHGTPPSAASEAEKPASPSPNIFLPQEDLKPLYDTALECKACQTQLGAAEADLADEKDKSQALGRERDSALQAAKGGSMLRRVARAAKWFAIGAAAGAMAAKLGS